MASKEWTQEQRERAADEVIERLDASPAEVTWNRWTVDGNKTVDLQCELNEARELLLSVSERLESFPEIPLGINVNSWLSRNK